MPARLRPSSGTAFHSLHATSQALHPMQTEVSVKKPIRGGCSSQPARPAGSALIVDLRTRLVGNARALAVLLDQAAQPWAARPAARTDVARHRLNLLDVHVRVQGQR